MTILFKSSALVTLEEYVAFWCTCTCGLSTGPLHYQFEIQLNHQVACGIWCLLWNRDCMNCHQFMIVSSFDFIGRESIIFMSTIFFCGLCQQMCLCWCQMLLYLLSTSAAFTLLLIEWVTHHMHHMLLLVAYHTLCKRYRTFPLCPHNTPSKTFHSGCISISFCVASSLKLHYLGSSESMCEWYWILIVVYKLWSAQNLANPHDVEAA